MKTVLLRDLAPGMRVGADIYNNNQLILLKNAVLTEEMIERIKNYNIPYVKIAEEDAQRNVTTSLQQKQIEDKGDQSVQQR